MTPASDEESPRFLGIAEVARQLSVHYNTVWRMVDRGEIPSVSVGSRRLVLATYVDELVAEVEAAARDAGAARAAAALDRNRAEARSVVRTLLGEVE